MHFTKIEALPERDNSSIGTRKFGIREQLSLFMELGYQYAKVEVLPGEYSNPMSAYFALRQTVAKTKLPIVVELINGEIYISRLDM